MIVARWRSASSSVPKIIINNAINLFFFVSKLQPAFCQFQTIAVSECCLMKLYQHGQLWPGVYESVNASVARWPSARTEQCWWIDPVSQDGGGGCGGRDEDASRWGQSPSAATRVCVVHLHASAPGLRPSHPTAPTTNFSPSPPPARALLATAQRSAAQCDVHIATPTRLDSTAQRTKAPKIITTTQ